MNAPFNAAYLHKTISDMLSLVKEQNAWPTWCLSNHDCERVASRIGADAARAMALFIFGLPGSAYVYNGQELGLPSGEMADSDRQDPIFFRTNGRQKGRDGARVPLPWSGDKAPFGFTTGKPWLPLQDIWKEFTVESELQNLNSSLNLYKNALALRKIHFVGSGEIAWTHSDGVLGYKRGNIEVLINISEENYAISGEVLLASHPVSNSLPPKAAVWLLR
jgi:alpha-glucosidase